MNTTLKKPAPSGRNPSITHALMVAVLGGLLAATPAPALAAPREVIPFTDARIRIEVNATDGDSGLHVLLDAEGWKYVAIFDPSGRRIFHVGGSGGVRKTGLTELFFESAEPGFEDLPLNEFLARFPAGEYRFSGLTTTGKKLSSRATLTHAIPDAPVLLSPPDNSVQDPTNTVLSWAPVADPAGSQIIRYEVLVTQEEPKPKRVLSAILPATATSMTVPASFLLRDQEYKWEVLAIEAGHNQTLSEGVFLTAP